MMFVLGLPPGPMGLGVERVEKLLDIQVLVVLTLSYRSVELLGP